MSEQSVASGRTQPPRLGTRLTHVASVPASLWFFLDGQVGYMRRRGFHVEAVASPGPYLDRFAEREGIATRAIDLQRRITPARDLLALARMTRVFRQTRPDIVQAGTPKGGLIGMIAARLAGVPVRIYQMHGLPMMTATGYRRAVLRWSERVSCALADRIFCVSHSLRDVAIAERLCQPERIIVIGSGSVNGVDAECRFNPTLVGESTRQQLREQLGIPLSSPLIGYAGRVVRDKGIVELADAWEILRRKWPDLHLLIVGNPKPAADAVPAEILGRLRRDPRVHLPGVMQAVEECYAIMDVLALPTHREGFGNVLLEASAMELPVVATKVTGCVDAVVDGETGTLVPPYDAAALAAALDGYLSDGELRARHGKAGRARALTTFRPETLWAEYYYSYLNLLAAKGIALPTGTTDHGVAGARENAG